MKTIGKEDLSAKLESPWVILVNVLESEACDEIHIEGSISIPRKELETGR